ncbi:ATP binding cassette subfamily B [Klebsormidium nitens]|uniref:ATP binding cassette subfamily B n=1 Tax=Klebsormidium nitens TaxID=105231 RepID=A0A1Y1HKD4_KLENI|nr:ATP binding cassette subfamily B [Klebsormidium nitens]|eukprot:GAQ79040.1 ATP binding cassette subfamily B [Klebsormidium nitens]
MGQGADGQPLEGAQGVPLDIENSPVGSTQPAAALASAAPLAGASAVPPSGTMEPLTETKSAEGAKGGPAKSVSFRKLFTYADKLDWICIVVGTLGAVAMGAAMPLLTLLFGRLINAFGNNSTDPDELYKQVKTVATLFVYLAIGAAVAAYCEVTLWSLAGTRQSARIRSKYLKAILRQDIGFFDTETSTGEVVGRMSGDTLMIEQAIGEKVGQYIRLNVQFIAGFAIAFSKGWLLTLVLLAVTPVLVVVGAIMTFSMTRLAARGLESYAQAGSLAEQVIGAIRTVVSFVGEKKAVQTYDSMCKEAYKVGVRQKFAIGGGMAVFLSVVFCTYALALWYGSRLILKGDYTGGDVMNVLFAVMIGGMSLGQGSPNLAAIASGRAAAYKMFQVIERNPPIDVDDLSGETPASVNGDIELRSVGFSYPARPDVKLFTNFSLSIRAGQTVALVGESGSGKSTVVSLIERFYDVTSGCVTLDGVDIRKLQLKWLRQQIGLVSQEPALFTASIKENIAYGKDGATMDEIVIAAKAANAHKFITKLPAGYDTQVGEHGIQLSGGQKQRVAIARAVLRDPRILLLDEATSALDSESERKVQDALNRVMVGRTTVVVAHRLTTIMNADKIAVVQRGAIVEEGRHGELMARPNGAYAALVRLQALEESRPQQKPVLALSHSGLKTAGGLRQLQLTASGLSDKEAGKSSPAPDTKTLRHRISSSKSEGDPPGDLETGSTKSQPKPVSFVRLAALARPELPFALVGTVTASGNGLLFPMFSLLLSEIITVFYEPPSQLKSDANFWAGMFVVLAGGGAALAFFQFACFGIMAERLIHRVRRMTFAAVLRQEISWFDDDANASGSVGARLSADAEGIKGLVVDQLGLTVQNLATITAGLILAFRSEWRLTLVVLSIAPLLIFGGYVQAKSMKDGTVKAKQMYEAASQVANDATGNIRTVAAFGAEDKILGLYRRQVEIPERVGMRSSQVNGVSFAFSQFVVFAAYALSYWYGGLLVKRGQASFKDVLQVFFAIVLSAIGISQTASMGPDLQKARNAVASIFAILDRRPQIDSDDTSGMTLPAVKGDIAFRNVHFAYPQRPDVQIFRGMSFDIESGRTVALVGESGSGKSTVIALIERFYDPATGTVSVDGVDIKKMQLKWLRKHIGLVSQEPNLFSVSIRDNIAYGKENATDEEIEAAARAANAHSFIERLPERYGTQVGERGVQLSGGQKQRVAIARAILKNPRIILLDEATSALDAESEKLVQDALDKVMVGRTTVVIAHRLTTVRNAHKIMVVQSGAIAEQGTHQELLKIEGGAYASLVKLHQASD